MYVQVAKAAGIAAVGLLVAAGVSAVPASHPAAIDRDVLLTAGLANVDLGGGTALIMGPGGWPDPGTVYPAAIDQVYLQPMGFTGNIVPVAFPWSTLLETWDARNQTEVTALVDAVKAQWETGDFSAQNPLVVVGFSESAVAASHAMPLLEQAGIPSEDLHFVLIGNTASTDGFLANFLPSLPEGLQEFARQVLGLFGLSDLLGVTTPTDLYPVTQLTLPGDMWGDWANSTSENATSTVQALPNMFLTHLLYPGLTPEQIGTADLTSTNGLIDNFTIPDAGFNMTEGLWNTAVNMGDVPQWLQDVVNGLFG